jgi:hypothetical protein
VAFTVTATESGASIDVGVILQVKVLTGAIETGGASAGSNSTSNTAVGGSLTPAFSHSLPVWAISADGLGSAFGAAQTGNTYYAGTNGNDSVHNWSYAAGYYSGTVTASTPVTYGAPAQGEDHANWCAYEIQPSGGSTPAVDGSSPAAAITNTLTTITTASFTPPAPPYVLVAMIIAGGNGTGAGITMTVTDTSGLSLIWTQRANSAAADNFQPTWVYTAAPAAGTPIGLATGAGAAYNPTAQLSTITIGPKYAGTATDLGGGSGAWGTPQFATGGP